MPRRARLDAPGVLQHVIARGIEKRELFSCGEDYEFFVKRLGKLVNDTGMECFAWALLTNHFHLLLRTSSVSLATFMRRLLTAYGVYYNRRYERSGHLFQNRYRSILCELDPYFLELVRYIHLNPIRAGIVKDLEELERYPWSGCKILMGKAKNSWQNTEEVLAYFGNTEMMARLKYRTFMAEGLKHGRRPDLVGQALPQSGEIKDAKPHDSRILGDSEFVKQVLNRKQKRVEGGEAERIPWTDLLRRVGIQWDLSPEELLIGGKRPSVVRARSILSYVAVRKIGMKTIDVAELLGFSQPAVSKSLLRGEEMVKENPSLMESLQRKL